MLDKTLSTWTGTLLFVVGLIVLGPLCYLAWLGAVNLISGGFSKDAWLQSVANIFGSALSGGVAAAVAIWILHREQRERDKVELATWRNTLSAVAGWVEAFTETIERETVAIAEHFATNDQKIIVPIIKALKVVRFPEVLRYQIANLHPNLFGEIVKTDAIIERFVQPLERSGTTGTIPGMPSAGHVFISALDATDIRTIAVLPDEFALLLLKDGLAEPALAAKCKTAAQRLFLTTDASIKAAGDKHGIVFNYGHRDSRPDWYSPT
jgi:hypothetical protein